MKKIKLLCVGGGSGGHVTPIFPVVEALREDHVVDVTMVVDKDFYEPTKRMIDKKGLDIDLRTMSSGCLRRYSNFGVLDYLKNPHIMWRNFKDLFRIALGFIQSFWLLREGFDVVFSKGGFVSLPLSMVASWKGIPLVIHDSDARPGLTNRILKGYADRIATGTPIKNYPYPEAITKHTGVPIQKAFFEPYDEEVVKEKLGLSKKPLLLLVGGSLGAKSLNDALIRDGREILDLGFQVVHVTGSRDYEMVLEHAPKDPDYRVIEFLYENMDQYLAASSIVLTRASATLIQELSAMKKAVILVPAKQLGDQLKNAETFKESGGALVLQDDDLLETSSLTEAVKKIHLEPGYKEELELNLAKLAKPDAAKAIARMIVEVLRGEKHD